VAIAATRSGKRRRTGCAVYPVKFAVRLTDARWNSAARRSARSIAQFLDICKHPEKAKVREASTRLD
jgi:hypothetical protein